MSKFKLKMKLQGFEIEVEGTREDVPLITQNIAAQISNFLEPAARIIEGEMVASERKTAPVPVPVLEAPQKKRARRRSPTSAPAGENSNAIAEPTTWRHDPVKWGTPTQKWSTADKGIWLLYVLKNEASIGEATGQHITLSFNKQFKQAGAIRVQNLVRDFGRLKLARGDSQALVAEDTTENPSKWYLTQAGEKRAQDLIAPNQAAH